MSAEGHPSAVRACRLEPVWWVRVELGPEDDDAIRDRLGEEAGLAYGDYDHVTFETSHGMQRFRGRASSVMGEMREATIRRARALTFSIPREDGLLDRVLTIIHDLHTYEEPVVHVLPGHASRALPSRAEKMDRRWWTGDGSTTE